MIISNKEFEDAYNDENNIKIMNQVAKRFLKKRWLSYNDVKACKMMAIWKCLQKHDNTKQKFTTSLWMHTLWQCQHQVQENIKFKPSVSTLKTVSFEEDFTQLHVQDILSKLEPCESKILTKRYLESKTLDEIAREEKISKETVRSRINKILEKIRGSLNEDNE